MDPIVVTHFEWHPETLRKIRRHGGSVRVCREVKNGRPRLYEQSGSGRTGSHLMIGPDANGRLWTIVIDYVGDGVAIPITTWPSKRSQIRRYEEADN